MDIINVEKAARLMGGDLELFRELFAIIEASLPEKVRNIEAALETESGADLELYAHQFKGALRNVAADEACDLLARLEKAGTQGDFVLARQLYPQVAPKVDEVLRLYHTDRWVEAFRKTSQ